jgi:hypothetical protein
MTVTTILGMGSSIGRAERECESVSRCRSRLFDREAIARRTLACAWEEMKKNARVRGHQKKGGGGLVAEDSRVTEWQVSCDTRGVAVCWG